MFDLLATCNDRLVSYSLGKFTSVRLLRDITRYGESPHGKGAVNMRSSICHPRNGLEEIRSRYSINSSIR